MAIGAIITGGVAVGEALGFSPTDIFAGARPRAGGADLCAPSGGGCAGKAPRNAGQNGAPPDFRALPSCPDASVPCGGGKIVGGQLVAAFPNKDDAVDCVPVESPVGSGRYWRLNGTTDCLWEPVELSAGSETPVREQRPSSGVDYTRIERSPESSERLAVQAGVFSMPAMSPMIVLLLLGVTVAVGIAFAQR